jgi:hypothetical protein
VTTLRRTRQAWRQDEVAASDDDYSQAANAYMECASVLINGHAAQAEGIADYFGSSRIHLCNDIVRDAGQRRVVALLCPTAPHSGSYTCSASWPPGRCPLLPRLRRLICDRHHTLHLFGLEVRPSKIVSAFTKKWVYSCAPVPANA